MLTDKETIKELGAEAQIKKMTPKNTDEEIIEKPYNIFNHQTKDDEIIEKVLKEFPCTCENCKKCAIQKALTLARENELEFDNKQEINNKIVGKVIAKEE